MPILFGTFNRSTATSAEVELSHSLRTAFANLAKNPNRSPAPHWLPYEPEVSEKVCTPTLAKIAYQGNVDFGNFIQPVQPNSTVSACNKLMFRKFRPFNYEFLVHKQDGPCSILDRFLDFRLWKARDVLRTDWGLFSTRSTRITLCRGRVLLCLQIVQIIIQKWTDGRMQFI